MAVKMYKDKNSIMVRGLEVPARLDAGWTLTPVAPTATLKVKGSPRTSKSTLKVQTTTDLDSPEDQPTIEENNNGY